MTLLPIVERELRVAARQKITWLSRLAGTVFGLLIFVFLEVLLMLSGASGVSSPGEIEFTVLKWLAFTFAAAAGVFLTADAVSEEKREGTLGLLFLTDLRGYDVLIGKLLSHSLRAAYCLLAAFPILGLPLLVGGLGIREFSLSLLVIGNTLLFSLSLGLLVSTLSREYLKALNGVVLLGLLFYLGPLFADSALAGIKGGPFQPIFSLADPAWLLGETGSTITHEFWKSLAIQHALAWTFLLLACVIVPRAWQDKTSVPRHSRFGLARRFRFGGPRFRERLRRRCLEIGPIHWLALRDRWLPRMAALVTTLIVGLQALSFASEYYDFYTGTSTSFLRSWAETIAVFGVLFSFILTLWVAACACRIFVDAVRSGALELILVTPVTGRTIVQAQWSALVRTFFFPTVCIVVLQLAGGVLSDMQQQRSSAQTAAAMRASAAAAAVTNGSSTATNAAAVAAASTSIASTSTTLGTLALISSIGSALMFAAGLAAVAWFGMWMGVTNHRVSVAVLKTVALVYILPWIAYWFIYGFAMVAVAYAMRFASGGNGGLGVMFSYAAPITGGVLSAIFNLTKDALFILWARRRLLSRLACVVSEGGQKQRRRLRIPGLPPAVPPVLTTP